MKRIATVLFLLFIPMTTFADRPAYKAVRAAQAPVIDGDLSDAVWQSAPEAIGFTQRDPYEGREATQQTRVKVAYTDEAKLCQVWKLNLTPRLKLSFQTWHNLTPASALHIISV